MQTDKCHIVDLCTHPFGIIAAMIHQRNLLLTMLTSSPESFHNVNLHINRAVNSLWLCCYRASCDIFLTAANFTWFQFVLYSVIEMQARLIDLYIVDVELLLPCHELMNLCFHEVKQCISTCLISKADHSR